MPKLGRRSEVPPLGAQIGAPLTDEMVNKFAPFGTKFTPTYRTKIVGGKPQYVQERGKRIGPVDRIKNEILDAATSTDQQLIDDVTSSQQWNSRSVVPPIPSPRRAPAGIKDQHATRPINFYNNYLENKEHNWETSILPPGPSVHASHQSQLQQVIVKVKDTEQQTSASLKALETTRQSQDFTNQNSPHRNEQINQSDQTQADVNPLDGTSWKPVAGYSYLPKTRVTLNRDEEVFLERRLAADFADCNVEQLRNVYNEITKKDHNLTGWIDYVTFYDALQSQGIHVNLHSLRIAAAACLSIDKQGLVDYEKLLSMLIAAVKKKDQRLGQYYVQNQESESKSIDLSNRQYDYNGSEGKLLRMIQHSITASGEPLDVNRLRQAFSKADRSHRLTLSQGEIKEVCYRERAPLHESVINNILAYCGTHGDGQYVWNDFLKMLERVQPQNTGYHLPISKRPLEYAKKYLQPQSSWPHPAPQFNQQQDFTTSRARDLSAVDHQENPLVVNKQVSAPAELTPRHHEHQVSPRQPYQQQLSYNQQLSPPPAAQTPRPWIPEDKKEEWFNGFKKMAEALYRNDLSRQGSIKSDHCKWMVDEYNEIYDLKIPENIIDMSIYRNNTTHGTEIDGLLETILHSMQPPKQ